MDRDEAHQAVQSMLDRVPQFAPVADKWRSGAKDDTVFAGVFTWTIFPHDGDVLAAAREWVADYARIMRTAGLDVQVGQRPTR